MFTARYRILFNGNENGVYATRCVGRKQCFGESKTKGRSVIIFYDVDRRAKLCYLALLVISPESRGCARPVRESA